MGLAKIRTTLRDRVASEQLDLFTTLKASKKSF